MNEEQNIIIYNAQMEKMVEKVYLEFDAKRKIDEAKQADAEDLQELNNLEEEIQNKS